MKKYFYILISPFILTGCQGYLEQEPDSSLNVAIDNEEKIAELLTGAYPQASYFPFLEARTDNVAERSGGIHSSLNEAMFFWQDYDHEDIDTPLNYWNSCYAGIAQVNKGLELLAGYPKSERVKALYGEAFLLRAYLHFMLVNIWSAPYAPESSKTDLGIPYLTTPEKHALVAYDRSTVAQVYDLIEKDLKLGISLVNDTYYKKPKFHFNKKAAYAFASRFYLMKGEWQNVVAYANFVLGADPKNTLRNWERYNQSLGFNTQQLYSLYTHSEEPSNLLLTTTESRIANRLPIEKYGSTINSVGTIFNRKGIDGCGDAGRNLFFQQVYAFQTSQQPITNGFYMPKFDELSLFGNTGTNPRDLYVTNVLFSTDEVLLNRMEAYAMLQEYDLATEDILLYLKAKFNIDLPCGRDMYLKVSNSYYDVYSPFYGLNLSQLSLVKIITELRQKEFLHEGLRWFDIRRFHIGVTRSSRNSLYQPLLKDDPRKVLQIPAEAINRGLKANPR